MASTRPALPKPNVLAHGDDKQFWVGQVGQIEGIPGSLHTTIYYRLLGQDHKWQMLARIPARVVSLSSQGSTAGVLLEGGSWSLLYTDGTVVTAWPLPGSARMLALAGGRNNWWAVGEVTGGLPAALAATRPAGSQPAAATQVSPTAAAQTTPQPAGRLVLFELNGNDWVPIAQIPGEAPDVWHVSLEIIDETPYIADLDQDGAVQVGHMEKNQWVQDLRVPDGQQIVTFRLLNGAMPPRLWVQQQSGPDLLYVVSAQKAPPLKLNPLPATGGRTLALFAGKLRMIADVQDKLKEQDFSIDTGAPDGEPSDLPLPNPAPLMDLQTFQTIVVIAAVVAIIFGWYRQQTVTQGVAPNLEGLTPAPWGRRLVAGLIDAAPFVLAVLFIAVRSRTSPQRELILWLAYWAAGLFYVLYMTLMEALAGRSLGKIVMGLRIVALDGKPPAQAALVVRNVLRLLDVGVFFVSVLLTPLFPLRQRPGDMAAGTLVVLANGGPRETEETQETRDAADQTRPEQ